MTAFPLLTEFSAVCCPFVIAFLALGTNNSSGWDFYPYFRQVVKQFNFDKWGSRGTFPPRFKYRFLFFLFFLGCVPI